MPKIKLEEIHENQKELKKIAEQAQKALIAENNIEVTVPEAILTIAKKCFIAAINMANEMKSEDEDVIINFMELFDIGISYRKNDEAEKEGNFTPFLVPGREMKLLAKDDAITEED